VLDIGCGAGQSTRDAARAAAPGNALGIDISEELLDRARRSTAEQRVSNATYERGDAQVHPFPPASFDVIISRFGTMFFADPAAAFRNIARAARPGGRLVMMVCQSEDRNEWATAIRQALGAGQPPSQLGPFSLANAPAVGSLLATAGFTDAAFADVREPMYFGPDASAALELVRVATFSPAGSVQLGFSSPCKYVMARRSLSVVHPASSESTRNARNSIFNFNPCTIGVRPLRCTPST